MSILVRWSEWKKGQRWCGRASRFCSNSTVFVINLSLLCVILFSLFLHFYSSFIFWLLQLLTTTFWPVQLALATAGNAISLVMFKEFCKGPAHMFCSQSLLLPGMSRAVLFGSHGHAEAGDPQSLATHSHSQLPKPHQSVMRDLRSARKEVRLK